MLSKLAQGVSKLVENEQDFVFDSIDFQDSYENEETGTSMVNKVVKVFNKLKTNSDVESIDSNAVKMLQFTTSTNFKTKSKKSHNYTKKKNSGCSTSS